MAEIPNISKSRKESKNNIHCNINYIVKRSFISVVKMTLTVTLFFMISLFVGSVNTLM